MRNRSYENVFHLQDHFHANQSQFRFNGFARRLVLKLRQRATRKWPITCVMYDWLLLPRSHVLRNEAKLRGVYHCTAVYQNRRNFKKPFTPMSLKDLLVYHSYESY